MVNSGLLCFHLFYVKEVVSSSFKTPSLSEHLFIYVLSGLRDGLNDVIVRRYRGGKTRGGFQD